jgi:hypothetical protein
VESWKNGIPNFPAFNKVVTINSKQITILLMNLSIMKNIISGLILFFAIMSFNNSFGQDFSKNSIKIGLGFGMHIGNNTEGSGLVYTIGYQREIWNKRLRFNPNFSLGQYSSKFLPLDARDQYFNSLNLEANLFLDLIKINSFSFVVGCGGLINNSRGMKGGGGDPDNYSYNLTSEYINDFHFGGYLGGGFRINSPNKRTSINIMPINVHFGTNNFLELNPKIEIDIKL